MASTSGNKGWQPPTHPRGYVARKVSLPPPIDGRVAGPGWDEAEWTDEFVDIEGPDKVCASAMARAHADKVGEALVGTWSCAGHPLARIPVPSRPWFTYALLQPEARSAVCPCVLCLRSPLRTTARVSRCAGMTTRCT